MTSKSIFADTFTIFRIASALLLTMTVLGTLSMLAAVALIV
jgi:hypothetical protein